MNVVVLKSKLDALANAIGIKAGKRVPQTLDELVETVEGIQVGIEPTGTIAITSNGEHDVAAYATADVSVPSGSANLQAKTRTITAAGTFTDTPDSGYDGLSSVETTVPQGEIFVEAPSVQGEFYTQNNRRMWRTRSSGGVIVGDGYGTPGFIADSTWVDSVYNSWYAVPANTSVTPTESSQTIGGARYMMEGAVTVNAISSSYVGSGITRRDSTDLTASGDTVSVPAGYYASAASKSVEGIPDGDEMEYGSAGLAGTTWYFNATLTVTGTATYAVNFTSNSTDYTELTVGLIGSFVAINYGSATAYNSMIGGWQNAAYRTVTFTGGADASNADLIAWVEANATQQ